MNTEPHFVDNGNLVLCTKCGGWYPAWWFGKHWFCFKCHAEMGAKNRRENKYRVKAHNTIRTHTNKYIEKGFVKSAVEFKDKYNWNSDVLASAFRKAYKGECPYCNESYREMPRGSMEMTIDITDPSQPPFWDVNTKIICHSCNTVKKDKTLAEWIEHLYWCKRWEEVKNNPYGQMTLPNFEAVRDNKNGARCKAREEIDRA